MGSTLVAMRFSRTIFVTTLAFALMAYAFDCGGMTTPEQAMECCKSMPCSSQGHHGQNCCKTMPAMHAPFVQPSSFHDGGYSIDVFAVLPTSSESVDLESAVRSVAAHCHAPPTFYSSSPPPLRI
jgi:hypothetical protein